MSFANFKPTIWSRFIQNTLETKSVLTDFCNHQFDGEAKEGERVWILGAPSPTIGDYDTDKRTNGIGAPEQLDGTRTPLVLDQAKFFNFMVDDIDKMQAKDGAMESVLIEKARKMLKQREEFVASLAAKVEDTNKIVSAGQVTTAKAAKTAVDNALLIMRENDVPLDEDVHIELSPFMFQLFRDWIIEFKTNNVGVMDHGVVGTYDGARVVMSNCIKNDGTDDLCMVRSRKAIAFVSAIDKMEAYRPEGFFADAIKGLNVYGGTIVRPDELVVIKAHK